MGDPIQYMDISQDDIEEKSGYTTAGFYFWDHEKCVGPYPSASSCIDAYTEHQRGAR